MKKIFLILILVGGIFITFNQNVISWVKSNFAANQTPYFQQRLEFFEKLSKEYYGVADYGKELESVNRSFELTDMSTDRAELIIPSLDAVTRLKERQSLAAIQDHAGARMIKAAPQSSSRETGIENASKKIEPSKSSMLFFVIGIILISAAISLLSFLKHRNKTRSNDLLKFLDDEPIVTDDSILLDFDLSSFEEKRPNTNFKLESAIY
jgi:hypothetical protein